jgi:hypothetical protein
LAIKPVVCELPFAPTLLFQPLLHLAFLLLPPPIVFLPAPLFGFPSSLLFLCRLPLLLSKLPRFFLPPAFFLCSKSRLLFF